MRKAAMCVRFFKCTCAEQQDTGGKGRSPRTDFWGFAQRPLDPSQTLIDTNTDAMFEEEVAQTQVASHFFLDLGGD